MDVGRALSEVSSRWPASLDGSYPSPTSPVGFRCERKPGLRLVQSREFTVYTSWDGVL